MQGLLDAYLILAPAAILGSALMAWQTCEHRRFVRGRIRKPLAEPCKARAALVVPCKGADVDLEANLRPLFAQDHGNYEIVFAAESASDPACAVIHRLRSEFPGQPSHLVIAGTASEHGQKVHNLLAATRNLRPEVRVLAFADADIRPPRDWLRLLTQRLDGHDASTGYRAFIPKRATLANCLLASMNGSIVPIMFPGLHHKVWGGSWAIRRSVFESCRLRGAWAGTLSDDLVAAKVLARHKHSVAVEPACIVASPVDMTLSDLFAFARRQLTIGRIYDPRVWTLFFAYSCLAQAAFLGGIGAMLWGLSSGADWTWLPATFTTTLYALHVFRGWVRQRAALYYVPQAARCRATRSFDIWLSPLSSLAIWCGLLSSAAGRWVVWKGIAYELLWGGQVRQIVRPEMSPADCAADRTPTEQKIAA